MIKKIVLILILALSGFLKSANAQVPDTLVYLQSIVNKKSFYKGKPFSVLMDSLKIQIKHFSPNTDIYYDISKETSTLFSFYFPQTADEIYLTYPCLRISWQPYLNAKQSDILYGSNNGGGWTPVVKSFYTTGIVKDIRIRE